MNTTASTTQAAPRQPDQPVQLREFTREDWYGLAGAEVGPNGEQPHIAYLSLQETGTLWEACVVADAMAVQVVLYPQAGDEPPEELIFHRDVTGGMRNTVALAGALRGDDMNPHCLRELGYEQIV